MLTRLKKCKFLFLVALLGAMLVIVGCGDDDDSDNTVEPEDYQNNFPTVQGILIDPNAPIYADDTVALTAVSTDPDNDHLRYTWTKNAGTFNPIEAVGETINWTAPSTRGTYQVTAFGDDGNGGTSQKHLDLIVFGGDQSGTVDVVGGLRANPVGGTSNLGYVDAGDTIVLIWDGTKAIITDSTEPDVTQYAPDGSRVSPTNPTAVLSPPQFGYAEGLPSQNAARYSLIGRIGEEGSWFAFNNTGLNTFSVVAPARGRLYLSLNEQESLLLDNTGYWSMSFTISHP
jgi:hypothetical protein